MKATVLIADHDPHVVDVTRRFLVSHGCEVATAANGLQCMEQLTRITPTVVVLDPDITWGGGDGVLEWLIDEQANFQPMVVVADDPESSRITNRLQPWVDCQIQRPHSLRDMNRFVDQLEVVAKWSALLNRKSAARQPAKMSSALE